MSARMNWLLFATIGILIMGITAQNVDTESEVITAPEKLPAPPPGPLDDCDPEMIGFELITGYVFSAPGNVLDSIPGTLMLTDCLETCQGNDSCQAVNYETGLCVLFSSNADYLPGKLYCASLNAVLPLPLAVISRFLDRFALINRSSSIKRTFPVVGC